MATVDFGRGLYPPQEEEYPQYPAGTQIPTTPTSMTALPTQPGSSRPPAGGGAPTGGGPMWDGVEIGSDAYWRRIEDQLKQAGGQMYDPSDLEGVIRNASNNQGESLANSLNALNQQLEVYRRRDPTNSYGLRQGEAVGSGGGGSQGGTPPAPAQFGSNPLTAALEAFAAQQAQNLQNPPQGSGQQMFEQILKDISAQFRSGGFTPGEQEVFQTQAIDPLERLRTARKQQVMQELSRRGLTPTSGIAQSMLADVDRQFDAQRATTQRGIAAQGAQETQQRMLQAVQLLSNLAGTEQGRLDKAGQYLNVPINLANNAWNQAFQLYSANNPLSLINPLMGLSNMQQGQSDAQGAAMADLIFAILQGLRR